MPYEPTPPSPAILDVPSLESDLDDIATALTTVNINLTKDERSSANSIDDDRLGFVTDYYGNKGDYPTMLPGFMNEVDADAHNTLRIVLDPVRVKIERIKELITDIQINSEHFTMEYAGEGYAVVGRAKDRNVPGADTFYDLLSRHFRDMGGTGETPGEPTP